MSDPIRSGTANDTALSLDDFLSVSHPNHVIVNELKGGIVTLKAIRPGDASLNTSSAPLRNRQTAQLLLDALQRSHGVDIASILAPQLDLTNGDVPLTGRMVQVLAQDAALLGKRLTAYNANLAARLCDTELDQLLAGHHLDAPAREQLEASLRRHAGARPDILTVSTMRDLALTLIEQAEKP